MEFLQKGYNLWLLMGALISGALFIWPSIGKLLSKSKEVGVAQAVQMINRQDAAVIDVREPGEFRGGHIPNARNIPLGQVAGKMKDLEKLKGVTDRMLEESRSVGRAGRPAGQRTDALPGQPGGEYPEKG